MSVVMSLKTAEGHAFPPLYKKTYSGAINEWTVFVDGRVIHTRYGLVDGRQQLTEDHIKTGKNVGRKNATTPEQQAMLEASSRWTKKQEREGYVMDITRAHAGETDAEGGIAPMLAQPLKDAAKHITFPCDVQRKYNGVRCIVVVEKGEASLWSRKRMRIRGVPHIERAYTEAFAGSQGRYVFDGEIYRHGWSLQRISGFVRKQSEPKSGYGELSHFVYDIANHQGPWIDRREAIDSLATRILSYVSPVIQKVETFTVQHSLESVKALHDEFVNEGYEGAILRDHNARYEPGKRSYYLVKMKEFEQEEFEIIGVGEGRGRMAGKAIFVCKTKDGKEFECVAPGSMEEKAEYLREAGALIGRHLTVNFFEWTEDGKPSHGTGVAVRDYE